MQLKEQGMKPKSIKSKSEEGECGEVKGRVNRLKWKTPGEGVNNSEIEIKKKHPLDFFFKYHTLGTKYRDTIKTKIKTTANLSIFFSMLSTHQP